LPPSGGHLYAGEIKSLKLEHDPAGGDDACESGLGKIFESGTFGLARVWHFAATCSCAPRLRLGCHRAGCRGRR
jgi:hypothetical protein